MQISRPFLPLIYLAADDALIAPPNYCLIRIALTHNRSHRFGKSVRVDDRDDGMEFLISFTEFSHISSITERHVRFESLVNGFPRVKVHTFGGAQNRWAFCPFLDIGRSLLNSAGRSAHRVPSSLTPHWCALLPCARGTSHTYAPYRAYPHHPKRVIPTRTAPAA